MSDVVSVVAQATTSSTWVDAPVSSTVSDSDAARFADLMSTQTSQAQAPSQVQATSQVQGPSAVAPTGVAETSAVRPGRSIGDAILSKFDSLGRHYVEQNSEINSFLSVDGAQLSPGRLLQLQIQMLDQSVVVDVASRVISKGVQEVDQLTKLQ
ncbi:MAG TPA: EscI/YscI/HrpB family type III secretion system inner rod protein [Ramlibacter sp.]|nr:EscI/YscI/HrpB family type III secretion system inner rod protein [Ramlibacter sp.]